MTEQSGRRKADKNLAIVILLLGPVISYIGWMIIGNYIRAGIEVYILVSVTMILLLVIWAWMGKPTWPYM